MEKLEIKYDPEYKIILNNNEVVKWMQYHYKKFNILYFDNILPPIESIVMMPIIRKVKYLGQARSRRTTIIATPRDPYVIKLNFIYDLSEIEWINVLLHEMIHIWQFTMGYSSGHGKTFIKKAKEINKLGDWGITTKYTNILENLKYVRN